MRRTNVGNGVDPLVYGFAALAPPLSAAANDTLHPGGLCAHLDAKSGSRWMPTVGSTLMLDRLGPKRSDAEFLKAKLEAPGARFLVLADLKPVIRSNPQRTEAKLAWFSYRDLVDFGFPVADALFLGVDKDSKGHFTLAVTEHRTRNVPGAIEKLRPIVDLRSLAMQGTMTPEELSLCGQARALAQWHENARCCGHCGGTTLVKDGGWRRKCW